MRARRLQTEATPCQTGKSPSVGNQRCGVKQGGQCGWVYRAHAVRSTDECNAERTWFCELNPDVLPGIACPRIWDRLLRKRERA